MAQPLSVTEGYLYAAGEIFYVPAAHFSDASGCELYFAPNFSTTENRTFKDTTTHDVWAYREYQVLYQNSDPGSGMLFSSLQTLISILNSSISSNLKAITSLAYASGFTADTSYNAVSLQGNGINGYMLEAAFNATSSAGKLCSLPVGLRPSADLVGFFFNNSVAPGILKIKKNGDVYVSGASTTSPNYITFQFYMNFEDLTLFALPTSGGGLPMGDR